MNGVEQFRRRCGGRLEVLDYDISRERERISDHLRHRYQLRGREIRRRRDAIADAAVRGRCSQVQRRQLIRQRLYPVVMAVRR